MNRARLSVATPVVTMLPGFSTDWEKDASIEDLAQIAQTADQLGYHHLTCSEHVALPAAEQNRRGARYWDPLATFGYLASRTQRIRLATNVRAVTLADGWAPFNVGLADVRDWLGRFEIRPGFEVVLPSPRLDPIKEPQRTCDILAEIAAHGAAIVSAFFTHTSLQHYLDNLQALAGLDRA